jgi:hypothetical protein
MIPHYMDQGSPEWLAVRLGIPTASEFHRIITAVKGDLSKQARKYAAGLVAETLLGHPLEQPPGEPWAMARGKALEPLAIQQYAFTNDVGIERVGFVTTDDGKIGCSPDGIILGARGGLEVKCTLDEQHMSIFMDGPGDDYKQQVQGNLAVAELEWWNLYAYHPELPPVTIRTYRDERYIAKMGGALREFLDIRDTMLAKARASGFFEQIANDNAALTAEVA